MEIVCRLVPSYYFRPFSVGNFKITVRKRCGGTIAGAQRVLRVSVYNPYDSSIHKAEQHRDGFISVSMGE